jgi:PAS domain S-box-containing protein
MARKPTYEEMEKKVEGMGKGAFLCKRIEEKLRASEKRCRAMFESTQEAIMTSDSDGIIISANPAAVKIFGFTKSEELIGSHSAERYADVNQREKLFKELFEKGFIKNYEVIFKNVDGKLIHALGTATLYRDEQGNFERVEGFFSDISDRKRVEAELLEAHDKLERRVKERTLELTETADLLERKHRELSHYKEDLEKLNQELVETNKALSVLARNIDQKREDIQKQIAMTINSKVLPIIEEFQKDQTFAKQQAELDVLKAHLNELTPDLKNGTGVIFSLSTAELRVAAMIKNGLTSP